MTHESELAFAFNTAQRAGKILTPYFGHVNDYNNPEAHTALKLGAYTDSYEFIKNAIRSYYPTHAIRTETDNEEGEYTWYVDPLSGAGNFSHGIDDFSVSIALNNFAETEVGAVHNPAKKHMYLAARQTEATLHAEPINVSRRNYRNWIFSMDGGFFYPEFEDRWERGLGCELYSSIMPPVSAMAPRITESPAQDLAYVAAGNFDAFLMADAQPWEIAAGCLLVEKAGGRVTDFAGKELNVHSKSILASNGIAHDYLLGKLEELGLGRMV